MRNDGWPVLMRRKAKRGSWVQLLGLPRVSSTIRAKDSSPPKDEVSIPSSTSTVYVDTAWVPVPTCGVVPGITCHVLVETSGIGPPVGSTPEATDASKLPSPTGGAPTMVDPTLPVLSAPRAGSSLAAAEPAAEAGLSEAVEVVATPKIVNAVATTSTGIAWARQP